ncbi:YfdX family protein [Nitratifractor sp.]|uniref:YfdX family protein n=1 Tax=Nitratifractor sp. TaxID=2268144 RepID=UPI0025CFDC9C|nr:YfdX family protein [Nitratifractor sp.]
MKKRLTMSLVASALILGVGTMSLQAAEGLKDTVAQKEAQALQKNGVPGESAAKATEEELHEKDLFMSKLDASTFAKEARLDRMKRLQRIFRREAAFHQEKDLLKQTPKEVMEAIQMTARAAQDIRRNKLDSAAKDLQVASKDFDKALKANPKLDLLPVAQAIQIKTFAGSTATIEKALKLADVLIQKHATQDARDLLMPLRDEMDFTVQYLPMKTYPLVTKKAAELLKNGKAKAALMVLSQGFGTLVAVTDVVPIPLMLAQDMTMEASKLAKGKKKEALKLLESAKNELKRAELLGYTQKHSPEYKALTTQINAIEKEIQGKNEPAKLYEGLQKKFDTLFKEVRKDRK